MTVSGVRRVRMVTTPHRFKMWRKQTAREEAGDRRTAAYERAKFLAPLTVRRERKRLKSPYAFR